MQLLAQLADEHVDDLQFGLVAATVKMGEKHLLGQGHTLAERQHFEDRIFLAGQPDAAAGDFDGTRGEIDHNRAGDDLGLGMTLAAPDQRMDARQ